MKTNVKTMQDLAAAFPEIYREHKLLCHAQKEAGSVVTLFETMPPEAVKKVIHAAGISDDMIIKNWNK